MFGWFSRKHQVEMLQAELARSRALYNDLQEINMKMQREAREERKELLDRLQALMDPATLREFRRAPESPRPIQHQPATAPTTRFPRDASQRPPVHLQRGMPVPLSRLEDADDLSVEKS